MSETTAVSPNPGELVNVGSIVTQKNKTFVPFKLSV